ARSAVALRTAAGLRHTPAAAGAVRPCYGPAHPQPPPGDLLDDAAAPEAGDGGAEWTTAGNRACRRIGRGDAARAIPRGSLGARRSRAADRGRRLMRILQVVHGYPPDASAGTEIYARDLARALADEPSDEVSVLTRDADTARPEYQVRTSLDGPVRAFRINN